MSTATTVIIGPEHDGQTMSLGAFEKAQGQDGFAYELRQGVVAVIDVPKPRHGFLVSACRRQLTAFQDAHAGLIHAVFSGNDCKIVMKAAQTERHPDLAVYLSPCPDIDATVWSNWTPEIVVEVVSRSSTHRDYVEKREDYLQAGVQEYWIIDAEKRQMTVLKRSRGKWAEHKISPPDSYATHLLPGLEFDCKAVFEAASSRG